MTAAIKHVAPATGLVEALIAARQEFEPVLKTKSNPHFKSAFAGLDDVIDAVGPALGRHGLALVQRTRLDPAAGLVLVTELRHTTGEVIDSEWPLVPAKANDPQALGSALTYGRRYQALAILGIAPEDDDGNAASGRHANDSGARAAKPPARPGPAVPVAARDVMSPQQLQKLNIALKEAGLTSDDARHDFCAAVLKCAVESTKDLTAEQGRKCFEAAVEAKKGGGK